MKSVVGLGVLGGALAFANDKVHNIPQNPFLRDACPSTSILHDGICQPATFGTPAPGTEGISFKGNGTLSLEDARALAERADNFPWTFWPECYSNENTTEPICVFTDQKFASGRGIYIVTTPTLAYQMLKKPAFSQPGALSRINNHANPPFTEHTFPHKGRGLIANTTLHRGDQIFASTPLLITNPVSYQLLETERLRLAHRGVSTLPPISQSLFWGLLDHFKGDPVDDRINTNAFEINIDGVGQYAVLPEIAMLNHDCRPNAAYFWDEATLSHYVHATQTIYPGEEISITYINNERVREKRVANLERNWGFECSCSACAAHPQMVAESDARIEQMERIAEALDDWTAGSTATPEMAELLISLYRMERLDASLGHVYKHAAEAYSSFGDRWNAVRYARLSIEYNVLDKGWADRDVGEMRRMAEDPERTWSWKKRVGHKRFEGPGCAHVH